MPPGTPTVVISPDPINNANKTAVTVSGTSNGATVAITVSDGVRLAVRTWSQTVAGRPVAATPRRSTSRRWSDGTITATVVATDAAGNTSGRGPTRRPRTRCRRATPTVLISPDPINAANQTAVTVSGTSERGHCQHHGQ